ncbi:MAG: outer membrane beta-barrel protein [Flavobacteriales bacterium]
MNGFVFLVLAGISCQTIRAQVSVGQRAGISLSHWMISGGGGTVAADWNNEQRLLPGSSVELPVEIPLFRKAFLTTGVAFIQQGYQFNGKYVQQYASNYIQVPLTIGWAFDVHRIRFSPSIGGAFGMNVRGSAHSSSGSDASTTTFPIGRIEDLGYAFRLPDQQAALLGRLGLAYVWRSSALTLDLSYQYGLSDAMFDIVFTDNDGNVIAPDSPLIPKASQRSYLVQLGYQLSLGRPYRVPKPQMLPKDTTALSATHTGLPKVMVGTRFGATRSTMSFSASLPEEETRVVDGAEPLIGVTAAVMVRLRLSEHWSLRPEFAYMQKGWRCQWYPRPTLENDLLRMTYLEVPVLAAYQFSGHRFQPYLLGGPVVGHGLGGVQVFHAVVGSLDGDLYSARAVQFGDQPRSGDYNPWDLSVQAGLGLSLAIGRSELDLDLRYQHGFSDVVTDPSYALYSEQAKASHRNWMLNIGYLMPWRK